MKGRLVQVFLRTPLFRGRYGDGNARRLDVDVVEIVGTVVDERSAGLQIRVSSLRDERGVEASDLPFRDIVLPSAKIDHLVLVEEEPLTGGKGSQP